MEHWAKKISRKNYPKTCSKHFWTIWERLWAFLEFWKFFEFYLKTFQRLDPPWNTGQKNFRKKYPKTCSKHVWALLGTILGIYGILKIFWFIKIISKTRPSLEHWAKNVSKKLPQNMFKTRLDKLGTFLGVFWILKIFLKTFRRLDLPWNTGQKKFLEKSTPKHV